MDTDTDILHTISIVYNICIQTCIVYTFHWIHKNRWYLRRYCETSKQDLTLKIMN